MWNKYYILLAVFIVILFPTWGYSNPFSTIRHSDNDLIIKFNCPPYNFQPITKNEIIYQRIDLNGWSSFSIPGLPQLPISSFLLSVSNPSDISIKIMNEKSEILHNILILPVPEIKQSSSDEYYESYHIDYSRLDSEWFPNQTIKIEEPFTFRGTTYVRILVYPFQWSPNKNQLRCFKSMQFVITGIKESKIKINEPNRSLKPFELIQKKITLNGLECLYPSKESIKQLLHSSQLYDASTRLRIEIPEQTMYYFTQDDLQKSFLSDSIALSEVRLIHSKTTIPIKYLSANLISKKDDPGIIFLGNDIISPYTSTNIYWLSQTDLNPSNSMETIDGAVVQENTYLTCYKEKKHFEENKLIYTLISGLPDSDYWFWEKMTSQMNTPYSFENTIPMSFPYLIYPVGSISIQMRGRTSTPRTTRIFWDNELISEIQWRGTILYNQTANIPENMISDGNHSLRLEVQSQSLDIVYLNWIEIEYNRSFIAQNNKLIFNIESEGPKTIQIKNFSRPDIYVFDITDPYNPKEIINGKTLFTGKYYIYTFGDIINEKKTYYALTLDQLKKPKVTMGIFDHLDQTSNGADLIIITPDKYINALEPLKTLRINQGLRVSFARIESIYNEFSYGVFDPNAIKQFLTFAYEYWEKPSPSYVLLVGNANIDYMGYLPSQKRNDIPTKLTIDSDLGLKPDDSWFGCVDGNDNIPDISIGRIPGGDSETIHQIIQKLIAYDQVNSNNINSCLFISDKDISYEKINNSVIANFLPKQLNSVAVDLSSFSGQTFQATQAIMDVLNQGVLIVNYVGHGDLSGWSGDRIIQVEDIALLDNKNKYPFIISSSCLSGYYAFQSTGISEKWVIEPEKGAVAVYSATGYILIHDFEIIDYEVFNGIFNHAFRRLGDIVMYASLSAFSQGVSPEHMHLFQLLGDPSMKLRGVFPPGDVNMNGQIELLDIMLLLKKIGMTLQVR